MEPHCKHNIPQKTKREKENRFSFHALECQNNVNKALFSLSSSMFLKEEAHAHLAAFLIRYHLSREERCWLACTALFALDYDEIISVTDEWWEDQQRKNYFHDV